MNKKEIKQYSLDYCERVGRRFTRVGKTFIDRADIQQRKWIRGEIDRHPSIGVTLK